MTVQRLRGDDLPRGGGLASGNHYGTGSGADLPRGGGLAPLVALSTSTGASDSSRSAVSETGGHCRRGASC